MEILLWIVILCIGLFVITLLFRIALYSSM
jgi:hypothetical protein